MPTQPHIKGGSFKPLKHESIGGGRVLPKAPEGHIVLLFWNNDSGDNPKRIKTVDDLKQINDYRCYTTR